MSHVGQNRKSDPSIPSLLFPQQRTFQIHNYATGRFAPEAALGGIEIPLPLYPRKLTQSRNRDMSEKPPKCRPTGQVISFDLRQSENAVYNARRAL
jgi:hypothetical protein